MRRRILFSVVILSAVIAAHTLADDRPQFDANWDSLNTREVPEWFRDAKFGIFIHWGVYSVPSICDTSTYSEWYLWWLKTNSHNGLVRKFHEKWYGKDFKYQDFAPMFRAELWQPDQWAKIFKQAGAKYVVLVSKHHDGFALWPSQHASKTRGYPWNSSEIGPGRDICDELARAVRAEGMKMGFYYSFMEWDNSLYDTDKPKYVRQHMIPQLKDLVTRYKPSILWPDGEWDYPDSLWRSTEIVQWLYANVENYDEFLVNDRWGKGLRGQVGDYYTTEYGSIGGDSPGLKKDKPFEECRGIGHSFALNRLENVDIYLDRDELVQMLITLVSNGGGLLLNLGPAADGRIPVIQQDRLRTLGQWLDVNGDSIYGTHRGLFDYLPWGRSTTKSNTIYLHIFDWPVSHKLQVPGLMTKPKKAYLLHDPSKQSLKVTAGLGGIQIDLLGKLPFDCASVIALEFDEKPLVSNSIMPLKDGSIVLNAERAKLSGGLRIETMVDRFAQSTVGISEEVTLKNIGFWTSKDAKAAWRLKARPGSGYEVKVEYACDPAHTGGAFVLDLAGEKFAGTVSKSTGAWQKYEMMKLGNVKIGKDPELIAEIQATEIPAGKALMNVRKIILKPLD